MKADKNDIVKVTSYAKVVDRKVHPRFGEYAECMDLDSGNTFNLIGNDVIKSVDSADEHKTTLLMSRTEVFEQLTKVGDKVFTVCFDKKDGSERVLRGRMVKEETGMGRSEVIDFDLPKGVDRGGRDNRTRQVDHRTLKWLRVGGITYKVKGI